MGKKKKQRGSGTHGGGSKKKRRGAGSRGGRGKAGRDKHKKIKLMKEEPERFGSAKGFKRPEKTVEKKKTVNLKELEEKIENIPEKEVEKEDDKIKVDLSQMGYDKLLGSGMATKPMIVEAKEFSKKAKEKIEQAEGKAIEIS